MEKSLAFNEAVLRIKTYLNPGSIDLKGENKLPYPDVLVSKDLKSFYDTNSDNIINDIVIGLAEAMNNCGNIFFSYEVPYNASLEDINTISDLVTRDLIKLLNVSVGCCARPNYDINKRIPIVEINIMATEVYM